MLMLSRTVGCAFLISISILGAQTDGDQQPPEKNPFDSPADVAVGRKYFLEHCGQCHGPDGEGGRGVSLTKGRYRGGASDRNLFHTVKSGVPGSEMPGSRLEDKEIWQVIAYVRGLGTAGTEKKATGDPQAGKALYETKGACAKCHVADNSAGGVLGPDLSEIGLRRSPKYLADCLIDPSADTANRGRSHRHERRVGVNRGYRSVTVITEAGETIIGIWLNEDDYSIQIRDLNENLRSFLKASLKEVRREKKSLMPAYGSVLSASEINDLVAYLSSLRGNK